MFPPVRVSFGLNEQQAAQVQVNPRDKYQVLMDILPYDNKRYRYAYHKSSWQQAGKADPPSPTKLFLHPDGPFTLDQLKRQVISFEKIKLTNNDANKHGYIVLNSMHKYQPRIHLVLWRGKESQSLANAPIGQLEQEVHKTFIFSETIFTAVTAYQNHSITKLKIDSNPFAKGFRDSSRLTDLELESMQDLISDGQCPFSPPRAPPPGFPHFLFAAAAQQQQQQAGAGAQKPGEDAASALLRERTIMALDSFLQQHHQSAGSSPHAQRPAGPHAPSPIGHAAGGPMHAGPFAGAPGAGSPFGAFLGVAGGAPAPAGQPAASLEQFIIQQQQQFAAAMAAAAAVSGAHAHPFQSLFAQMGAPGLACPASATPNPCAKPEPSPPSGPPAPPGAPPADQTSPIGAAKSAARSQMLAAAAAAGHLGGVSGDPGALSLLGPALGGAPGPQPGPGPGAHPYAGAGLHPQQLQAMMQQHHQQMAALSMQGCLDHQQQQHHQHHQHHHHHHHPQQQQQQQPQAQTPQTQMHMHMQANSAGAKFQEKKSL